MEGSQFDHLTRRWATRRMAIGGLIFSLFGITSLDAEARRTRNRKSNRNKKRKRAADRADTKKRHDAVRAEKKKREKKCKGGTVKCGKACCNDGPGTGPRCKTPANGGFCPPAGTG